MNKIVSQGIILARTDYGEADRIITMLTPDHGKVKLIAKGVRRVRSKLAGGIELFSISSISYIPGKREISTLISTRLIEHFENIVKDLDRTMFGYDILKIVNRGTEDLAGIEYFELISKTFQGLNDVKIDLKLIRLWFWQNLLKLSGHSPNLSEDNKSQVLNVGSNYNFDIENMHFSKSDSGIYGANHIKLLRLATRLENPLGLGKLKETESALPSCLILSESMVKQFIRF